MSATTADDVYARLRRMLSNAELVPGQRVSQSKLARQIGCSTLPVLEAMRRLESERLLTKEPRKMARVRALSDRELEGLYLVREALESVTARLCAERISRADADRLIELGERYKAAATALDHDACDALELAIHGHIARCAECPLLAEELDRLLLVERTAVTRPGQVRVSAEALPHLHTALIRAVVDGDADSAEYLMRRHIRAGWEAGPCGNTRSAAVS